MKTGGLYRLFYNIRVFPCESVAIKKLKSETRNLKPETG